MKRTLSRAPGADHPPSTDESSDRRRRRRWPVPVAIMALAGIGVAATVAAAEPAEAPVERPVAEAEPATPVIRFVGDGMEDLGRFALAHAAGGVGGTIAPVQQAATTTTTQAPTTTTEAPTTTTEAPAPTAPPVTAPPVTAPPVTAPPTTAAPAPAPAVSNGSNWDALAQCESGGNWAINTGNGYYGGLQFSASSWRAVGGTGLPHEHSRETQIAMGERLRASQGWGAWPHCSSKLGLR